MPNIPLLRYPGAKNRLAAWILSHFPEHDSYAEPFAGSAAVLLNKPRSPLEAINDLSGDVVNLFRQLRDRPEELIYAIKWTPWAAEEYDLAKTPADDPLERARRFYLRCWASIRPFDETASFRRQKVLSRGRNGDSSPMTAAAHQFMRVKHLHGIADRLRGVTIEQIDALEFVDLYGQPDALLYLDPPYPLETRGRRGASTYQVEMSNDDHVRMAGRLHAADSMIVLSGYRCPLYDELFGDWRRVDRSARIDGGGSATESLWLNPAVMAKRPRQLSLLGANGDAP